MGERIQKLNKISKRMNYRSFNRLAFPTGCRGIENFQIQNLKKLISHDLFGSFSSSYVLCDVTSVLIYCTLYFFIGTSSASFSILIVQLPVDFLSNPIRVIGRTFGHHLCLL